MTAGERIGGYGIHPAAAMFPMMSALELAEMVKDLGEHGLRDDIVLIGDLILDGRNRCRACVIAGVKPRVVQWDGEGGSPEAYVFSKNVLRRHLQEGQRAMLAAQLLPKFEAEAKARQLAGAAPTLAPRGAKVPPPVVGKAAAQVAAAANVGTRSVERAKAVAAKAPELAAKLISGEIKSLKQAEQQIRRTEQHQAIARYVAPTGRYGVIVSDPPWPFETRTEDETHRANLTYPPMSLDEIAAMRVRDRADKDCILFLWTTKQHLLDHSAARVAYAWGFEVRTFWDWVKVDKAGSLRLGAGNWGRNCSEHVVVCTRGKPVVDFSAQPSVFYAQRREHSRKPDEFFDIVERCCPALARLEMFARESRKGWVTSGAEGNQFDTPQTKLSSKDARRMAQAAIGELG